MSQRLSRRRFLAGSAAVGVATGLPRAQATTTGAANQGGDGLAAFVEETVTAELEDTDATGAVVSVVQDGSVVHADGYGETPFDGSEVTAEATPLELGSISKLFTFTSAMQLADEGVVDLNNDVNASLESVSIPDTYDEPVTLSHLATHTAGFENRIRNETVEEAEHRQSLATAVKAHQPARVRPPGERFLYTNYAAALTGQLVADVSGQSFYDYAAKNLFDPLGLDRTTFADLPDHINSDTRDALDDYLPWYANTPPAAGLWSTGTDVAQFMLAHLNDGATDVGRVLSAEATSEMHQRRFTPDEEFDGMAFGFFERHRDGVRLLTHPGEGPGYRSSLVLAPELDLGLFVSFLGRQPGTSTWSAQAALLDHYVQPAETKLTPDGQPERAEDLAGTYRKLQVSESTSYEKLLLAAYFLPDTTVRVADDGTLVTEGDSTRRWVEVEPLVFRRVDGRQTMVFHEDDGEITGLSFSAVPYEEITARGLGALPSTHVSVSSHEEAPLQGSVALVSLLTVLTASGGWPLARAVRRLRGSPSPSESTQARRARWAAGGAGTLLVGFVVAVLLVWTLAPAFGAPKVINLPPPGFELLFAIPIGAAGATVAGVRYTVLAWREGFWSLLGRIHYTLVVVALGVLVWLFQYWNLLGL